MATLKTVKTKGNILIEESQEFSIYEPNELERILTKSDSREEKRSKNVFS